MTPPTEPSVLRDDTGPPSCCKPIYGNGSAPGRRAVRRASAFKTPVAPLTCVTATGYVASRENAMSPGPADKCPLAGSAACPGPLPGAAPSFPWGPGPCQPLLGGPAAPALGDPDRAPAPPPRSPR